MDIPIHDGFNAGMAEQLLLSPGRNAVLYCPCCISMAEGMQTKSADTGCAAKLSVEEKGPT